MKSCVVPCIYLALNAVSLQGCEEDEEEPEVRINQTPALKQVPVQQEPQVEEIVEFMKLTGDQKREIVKQKKLALLKNVEKQVDQNVVYQRKNAAKFAEFEKLAQHQNAAREQLLDDFKLYYDTHIKEFVENAKEVYVSDSETHIDANSDDQKQAVAIKASDAKKTILRDVQSIKDLMNGQPINVVELTKLMDDEPTLQRWSQYLKPQHFAKMMQFKSKINELDTKLKGGLGLEQYLEDDYQDYQLNQRGELTPAKLKAIKAQLNTDTRNAFESKTSPWLMVSVVVILVSCGYTLGTYFLAADQRAKHVTFATWPVDIMKFVSYPFAAIWASVSSLLTKQPWQTEFEKAPRLTVYDVLNIINLFVMLTLPNTNWVGCAPTVSGQIWRYLQKVALMATLAQFWTKVPSMADGMSTVSVYNGFGMMLMGFLGVRVLLWTVNFGALVPISVNIRQDVEDQVSLYLNSAMQLGFLVLWIMSQSMPAIVASLQGDPTASSMGKFSILVCGPVVIFLYFVITSRATIFVWLRRLLVSYRLQLHVGRTMKMDAKEIAYLESKIAEENAQRKATWSRSKGSCAVADIVKLPFGASAKASAKMLSADKIQVDQKLVKDAAQEQRAREASIRAAKERQIRSVIQNSDPQTLKKLVQATKVK